MKKGRVYQNYYILLSTQCIWSGLSEDDMNLSRFTKCWGYSKKYAVKISDRTLKWL